MRPEIQRCRLGEQTVEGNVAALGARGDVIVGMSCVVEQRTRLDEYGQHIRPRIVAKRYRALIKVRQEGIGALEAQAPVKLLEQVAQSGVC